MRTKYKNTNVKFNMDDPMQAEAWNYLQVHKGTDSYAKIISLAISEATKKNEKSAQADEAKEVNLSEGSLVALADLVASALKDRMIISKPRSIRELAVTDTATETAPNKSLEEKPDKAVTKEETEYNAAFLTQDLLDFASG